MKKNLYLIMSFMILFSCQTDEIEQNSETLNAVYSKSKKNDPTAKDKKKDYQYICHKLNIGNDWKFITLYLPNEAIQAHLDHGDELGECPVSETDQVDGCDCSGNVTRLDLRYNGADNATISITGSNSKKEIYRAKLGPGELFIISAFDRNKTLGEAINISVDGIYNTVIDTGCSEPNILGYTYGDFTIEGGSSLNGGEFCRGEVM